MPVLFLDKQCYRGSFLSVKELSAHYRVSVRTMRVIARECIPDLGKRKLLSPAEISRVVEAYGAWE